MRPRRRRAGRQARIHARTHARTHARSRAGRQTSRQAASQQGTRARRHAAGNLQCRQCQAMASALLASGMRPSLGQDGWARGRLSTGPLHIMSTRMKSPRLFVLPAVQLCNGMSNIGCSVDPCPRSCGLAYTWSVPAYVPVLVPVLLLAPAVTSTQRATVLPLPAQ